MLKRAKKPDKIAEYEAELALPELPRSVRYLWNYFQRLRNRRGSNGYAANPISWQDIVYFQQLSGFRLKPWEVEVIEDLDNLDRSAQTKSLRATNQSSSS